MLVARRETERVDFRILRRERAGALEEGEGCDEEEDGWEFHFCGFVW